MKQKNVILMVVAVGCGLVAAFLTSQMSAKPVEQVEVVVAAKDLPVGTVFTKEEMKSLIKMKKVSKDGLPPAYITNPDELIDKRLSRPRGLEETFNPADLNKGMALPDGCDLMALSIGSSSAASGFIVPGSRVDIMASLKLGNTLKVFKLLVNTLIVNVNQDTTNNKNGVYPDVSQVGLALTEKERVLLELARARSCNLVITLRNTNKPADSDKAYNIDEVIKLLEDGQNPTVVKAGTEPNEKRPDGTVPDPVKPADPVKPMDPVKPVEPPVVKVVKVLVAKHDIAPHTDVTADLVAEAFELKELPKDFAGDAMSDLTDALGKQLKTGVAKGQWVTPAMVGIEFKQGPPQDPFVKPDTTPTPVTPPAAVKPVARKKHDLSVHTASGTVVHRYEEVAPGQWKKIAELSPEQAARDDNKAEAPKAAPDARKVD